jgi:NADH/NAD ratio-sensing transcriptional regulator Rex
MQLDTIRCNSIILIYYYNYIKNLNLDLKNYMNDEKLNDNFLLKSKRVNWPFSYFSCSHLDKASRNSCASDFSYAT